MSECLCPGVVLAGGQATQPLVSVVGIVYGNTEGDFFKNIIAACRTVPRKQTLPWHSKLCGNDAGMVNIFLFSEAQHHKEKSTHTQF